MFLFLQVQMVPQPKENGRTWGETTAGTIAYCRQVSMGQQSESFRSGKMTHSHMIPRSASPYRRIRSTTNRCDHIRREPQEPDRDAIATEE